MYLLTWLVVAAVLGAIAGYFIEDGGLAGSVLVAVLAMIVVVWLRIDGTLQPPEGGGPSFGRTLVAATRWGKVLAIVGGLIAFTVAAYMVKDGLDDEAGFLWRDASVELQPVDKLKGVKLGESFRDVSARLGAFDPEPREKVDTPTQRGYMQRNGPLRLLVDGEQVLRVSYECRDVDETRVNRIKCNAGEQRIVEVFGNGARRLCAKVDKGDERAALAPFAFAFDVLDTGTRYVAIKGQVRGFIIMAPQELERSVGGDLLWHRCGG